MSDTGLKYLQVWEILLGGKFKNFPKKHHRTFKI